MSGLAAFYAVSGLHVAMAEKAHDGLNLIHSYVS